LYRYLSSSAALRRRLSRSSLCARETRSARAPLRRFSLSLVFLFLYLFSSDGFPLSTAAAAAAAERFGVRAFARDADAAARRVRRAVRFTFTARRRVRRAVDERERGISRSRRARVACARESSGVGERGPPRVDGRRRRSRRRRDRDRDRDDDDDDDDEDDEDEGMESRIITRIDVVERAIERASGEIEKGGSGADADASDGADADADASDERSGDVDRGRQTVSRRAREKLAE